MTTFPPLNPRSTGVLSALPGVMAFQRGLTTSLCPYPSVATIPPHHNPPPFPKMYPVQHYYQEKHPRQSVYNLLGNKSYSIQNRAKYKWQHHNRPLLLEARRKFFKSECQINGFDAYTTTYMAEKKNTMHKP